VTRAALRKLIATKKGLLGPPAIWCALSPRPRLFMHDEHFVFAPMVVDAKSQPPRWHARFARPFQQCFRLAPHGQEPGIYSSSLISALLGSRCPSNIARLVVAVIVRKSVQRERPRWSVAHVSQKCREIASPFRAHGDSSTAVVFIAGQVGAITAILHRVPRTIFCCSASLMRGVSSNHDFPVQTSTRLRLASSQAARIDGLGLTAVTSTQPVTCAPAAWCLRDHLQPPKSLSNEIDYAY
jgi:hypothetical protein